MAKIVQKRRGTTEQHKGFDGQQGEVTVDLTENTIRVHDGSSFPVDQPSGFPLARSDMSNVADVVGIIQLNLQDGTQGQAIVTDGSGNISFSSSADASGSIVGGDISGTVGNAQIIPQAVGTTELTDLNVTRGKLEPDAVDNSKLADDAVRTENIVNEDVTTPKIADFNVTRIKIDVDAVDNSKLADDAVQTENIVDSSVTTIKIADLNVTRGKLEADAVNNSKLADNAVQNENIVNQTIGVEKLFPTGLLPGLDGSQLINIITVPEGLIAMWHGDIVNIPIGWALCDGGNGTPDLSEKFIIGTTELANGTVGIHPINSTGGSTDSGPHTLTIAEMPSHTHPGAVPSGNSDGDNQKPAASNSTTGATGGSGSHTHSGSLPPYYALAYIMRLAEGSVAT